MKIAAIYYFMIGIFLLLAAFDTYFALPLLKFYRYYVNLHHQEHHKEGPKLTFFQTLCSFGRIFTNLWVAYWNVFATFFVTLFAFPNVVMWIAAGSDENFFIGEELYAQILCFLTFNVCAFLGNLIPNFLQKPGPKYLWIFTTARFVYMFFITFLLIVFLFRILFIPFFLLFNYKPDHPDRRFPVIIKSSWAYWLTMILMSVTHGHGSSLAMMYAPKLAAPKDAHKAAMLAGVFLVLGVNFGIISSAVVDYIMFK